jgi:uncharacterized protein
VEDLKIRETDLGVDVPVHVQPRARKNEIAGLHGGVLKVRTTAPPVDDAANRAVVEYFSRLTGVPKSKIRVASGLHSREKTVHIDGLTRSQFLSLIRQ